MIALQDRAAHTTGRDLARGLFAGGIALGCSDPRADQPTLMAAEVAAIARARPARLREFAAGRSAARRAMAELGAPQAVVPMGPDRAPIWPEGLIGSISHSRTCCIVALARSTTARAIALDVEENTPLDRDLVGEICTPSERDWLLTQPAAPQGHLAKLIFSAKECAWKCQYALSRAMFGFDGLEIALDLANGQFRATFTQAASPFVTGDHLDGRFATGGGLIVTAMALAPLNGPERTG